MILIVKVAAEFELRGPTVFDPYPKRQQYLTIAQRQHIAFSLGGAVPVDRRGLSLRSPKGHHPATVSSLIHTKHFLGYPEYF